MSKYDFLSIPYYANLQCDQIGIDSLEKCLNRKWYQSQKSVDYHFNDLGYRCVPSSEFKGNEILAIGDSFTVGLGLNVDDTWPGKLQKILDYPVLNFSLNGASNDWIARKLDQLLTVFEPRAIVIHYTFSHRRELDQPDWYDDERTLCLESTDPQEDLDNWYGNYKKIMSTASNIPLLHSFLPNWHCTPVEIGQYGIDPVKLTQYDSSRDGFHYGVDTSIMFAEDVAQRLTKLI
jgi:lysophospholipase L1-like esterase